MTDRISSEQRRHNMQRIKAKDTRPEIAVRKWLYAKGIRYRKNDKRYPGTPDIIIPNGHVAIFINGCFWHGHEGCKDFVIPKTRTDWWIKKISSTQTRDEKVSKQLQDLGWHVLTVWECQTKFNFEQNMETLLASIRKLRSME